MKSKDWKRWSKKEIEVLRGKYPKMGYEVCKFFPDRSLESVISKAKKLRLCKNSTPEPWTQEELDVLKENYPKIGYKVCDLIPTRTATAVIRKADVLRLRVDRKTREQSQIDRIGYLDIEASNLKANFGICFSWCIKEQGVEHTDFAVVTKAEMQDGTMDKRVIEELIETLKKYTVIYTYYGSRFDVPFLRTRALMHGLEFPPVGELLHKDLYYLVRNKLQLNRNSLDVACGFLGIEGKTHINWQFWIKAMTGDEESLNYIFEHNKADVEILEKLHERLAKFETLYRRYM